MPVPRGQTLRLTSAAAAELCRQAAVAGTPGMMHLDLLAGTCEQWVLRLRAGHLAGSPVARADGITLYAPSHQQDLLAVDMEVDIFQFPVQLLFSLRQCQQQRL